LIFSFLGNNQGGKNHEATDALDALCIAMLEEFDPKPQKPLKSSPERKGRARTPSAAH
jgi:hypothetical protein